MLHHHVQAPTTGDDSVHDDADTSRLLDPEPIAETKPKSAKPSKPAAPATPVANKILFLDGLRGLAAMMVIVMHAKWVTDRPLGQPAVDIFFVLSAFLLTMIFEKKARTLLQQQASRMRWAYALADYFVRRFLRVYPLFAIVAIFVSTLTPEQRARMFAVHEEYDVMCVLAFEFRCRYHVFWTLPLEIAYYFIIPVLVVGILKLGKYWLVPVVPLAYFIMHAGFHWFRLDHQPLTPHLPTFLCGSLAAILYAKLEQSIAAHAFVFRWYHVAVLRVLEYTCLALLVSAVFNGLFFDWVWSNPIPQGPGGRFISPNVSVIIVAELLQPGAIASVLEWSLLRHAGKVSFSMYMWHSFVVYSKWIEHQPSYYNKFFAIWGLTFIVSTVSYHAIEAPCQWLTTSIGAAIKKKDAIERLRTVPTLPTGHDATHTRTV